jgi:hypothetical protein
MKVRLRQIIFGPLLYVGLEHFVHANFLKTAKFINFKILISIEGKKNQIPKATFNPDKSSSNLKHR